MNGPISGAMIAAKRAHVCPISGGLSRLLADTAEQSRLLFEVRGFGGDGCGFPTVYRACGAGVALAVAQMHARVYGKDTAQVWRGERMLWPKACRPMNYAELRRRYELD